MNNEQIADFFTNTKTHIYGNVGLREPQREGYDRIANHFRASSEAAYVMLPVGCGKTGLMGITPFGVTDGRVLIVTPNLTIRKTVVDELDVSDPNNFYAKRGVFVPTDGPFISVLKSGANIHDCDNAHIVVANIQQFARKSNRWYEQLDPTYFRMILVDEGHHNVAESWRRMFEYFVDAKVVSYTGTPARADGRMVEGVKVYSFGYQRSMMMGFISPIDAVYVVPGELKFTIEGQERTLSLDEVMQEREEDRFSRGVALSEECNRHIVQASLHRLREVRRHGSPRQIIACACSIRHAESVKALYVESGLKAEVLHSKLPKEKRESVEHALRLGVLDVVVQVQILGEGYSLNTLSVAAVFRPYRSLAPYIQFVGRILRLAEPKVPSSPGNKVFLVSHVGLNDDRWWKDFTKFDTADGDFFREYLAGNAEVLSDAEGSTPRMTLRPFMRVLNETVEKYIQTAYLKTVDRVMVDELVDAIRAKGFEPEEFGLTADMLETRLRMAKNAQLEFEPYQPLVQPQRAKEALRIRLRPEARAIADTLMNRLEIGHGAGDLVRAFPGRGPNNVTIALALAAKRQNAVMGIKKGERDSASIEQLRAGVDASADILDGLTKFLNGKLKRGRSDGS